MFSEQVSKGAAPGSTPGSLRSNHVFVRSICPGSSPSPPQFTPQSISQTLLLVNALDPFPWICDGNHLLGPLWVRPKSALDLPWIYPGSALDPSWVLSGSVPLDLPWILPGSSLDPPWICPGSTLGPPESALDPSPCRNRYADQSLGKWRKPREITPRVS